jgi:nucleotide sugar dehydrogenase
MNVGILGVGKLGLVYALSFGRRGVTVYASSYKQEYVESLQQKNIDNITEPGIADLLTNSKNITFTIDNHEVIKNCDIMYVMVATPSLPDGSYDITAVHEIAKDVLDHPDNIDNKILIIGSTVNPGDTEIIQKIVEPRGVRVVYSPTFAAQGTVLRDIENPVGLLLGTTDNDTLEKCQAVFFNIIPNNTPVYQVHSTSAEILKIALNCYSTMRINYFNMVGQVLIKSGLDQDIKKANECISHSDNKKGNLRFGFGYGGPCFPRDNRSFSNYMDKIGMTHHYADLTDQFNQEHIEFLTQYFLDTNVNDLDFYFPYISYKPGVKIFEESHQLDVCRNLLSKGANVFVEPTEFVDPIVQKELEDMWGAQIQFVALADLEKSNHPLYKINL